jgi:uncharacterized protein DUF3309
MTLVSHAGQRVLGHRQADAAPPVEGRTPVGIVLLIILVVLLIGGLPQAGWHSIGYAPSGLAGVLLILLIILLLTGRL